MTVLNGVSDEFLDWLDQCPVNWHLKGQSENTLTYVFDKEE